MSSLSPTAIVADDHRIVRDGLRLLLTELGIEVVAELENGLEALAAAKRFQPDLALLDVAMPLAGGLDVLPDLKRWSPKTKIVVFTGIETGISVAEVQRAGIAGAFLKSDPLEILAAALPAILTGQVVTSPNLPRERGTGLLDQLTARERQVLGMLLNGQSNRQIAGQLHISTATVNNHRANLMAKLDVHSFAELVNLLAARGLLEHLRE